MGLLESFVISLDVRALDNFQQQLTCYQSEYQSFNEVMNALAHSRFLIAEKWVVVRGKFGRILHSYNNLNSQTRMPRRHPVAKYRRLIDMV